ncbi:glycerol-3-phosphate dehydrogenase (NAD(+)) [Rhinocladiella mackenziei CBS 650.93]|uniref:Glycerol-3-phosphate dehydrogenase [NAD(+)] n=1 Tax=Rhinocladiella mackenziei CBS 650.93 TaxID=1442369 RepID=A0A0D2GVE9_9EURO|nr:glycerol-3-phosphate dehydrogenase (NAD(+)) [Rhinocladiella mackenziei CBS 650.93]KIX02253.1 glycerol-3-phosphate dehydrogenase (NAD(+)) [Rhinocladiella mackenziei CBS 650.93]
MHARTHKITVVGSGNWGTAVSKIVAENAKSHSNIFEPTVNMWIFEEEVTIPEDSKHRKTLGSHPMKLTDIINSVHENVKYLPGIALPSNLVANASIQDAVKGATILIFNLPHQFMVKTCQQIQGHNLPYARGISCVKGVEITKDTVSLFSEIITETLGIYCGALSGANLAPEVAAEKWCETTIGYDVPPMDVQQGGPESPANISKVNEQREAHTKPSSVEVQPVPEEYVPVDENLLQKLFHRPYFNVHIVPDVAGVALSGALKNIVTLAAGFVAGRDWGDNAKAAIMRIGLLEMMKFSELFFPDSTYPQTITQESAGVSDLIASCCSGRNYRSAVKAAQTGKTIDEIEQTEMNGQKLQGASTARQVHSFLEKQGKATDFPLFTAVYEILESKSSISDLPRLVQQK